MFFQQLINGLSIGSIYALMAVGYSLIYSLLNFTNFAHSITVTIGAFCAFFFLSQLVQNLFLGILIAVLAAGGLAMLIELLGYRPLLKKKARRIYLLITGLGISTMCENLIIISFSSRFRVYPVNFSNESINLFGASVGQVDLIIFAVSITALVLVELFIRKSRVGLAIRGGVLRSGRHLPDGRERAEADSAGVFDRRLPGRPGGGPSGREIHGFPDAGHGHDQQGVYQLGVRRPGKYPRRGSGGDHAGNRRDHDLQLYFLLHAGYFSPTRC